MRSLAAHSLLRSLQDFKSIGASTLQTLKYREKERLHLDYLFESKKIPNKFTGILK
jgi:hypothetical protein